MVSHWTALRCCALASLAAMAAACAAVDGAPAPIPSDQVLAPGASDGVSDGVRVGLRAAGLDQLRGYLNDE